VAAALFLCGFVCAEQSPPPNGNEMPLELYQKLKGSFDALYGAQVAMLPGVAPLNKGDSDKALRADAAANKDALIKALGSSQVLHREMAARALEYCGDKAAAVQALTKTVAADTDTSVRRAAAATLAKLPDAAAVEALIKGLGDNEDSVRGLSATALGNIKDNRAGEPLLKVLASESKPLVRLQAATALSKIKDKATLEGLTKALENEKDERVKMAIAGAVRNILGGENAQTEPVPSADDVARELAGLAKEMKEVEEKLRNDRHDQAVQVQGTGIEKKLAELILKLDKG
jgi:HEAT repeat protein